MLINVYAITGLDDLFLEISKKVSFRLGIVLIDFCRCDCGTKCDSRNLYYEINYEG